MKNRRSGARWAADRKLALGRIAEAMRAKPSMRSMMVLYALLIVTVALSPARLMATESALPTVSPTPMVTFAPPTPLPSEEEFFGTDDRSEIPDYENPAYTADAADDPGIIESFLDELMKENSATVDLVILLTLMSVIPTLLIMMTGFTRIVIVLSFTRNAMGTQNMPPNQVIIGLAIFLTFFLMYPVLTDVLDNAAEPYIAEEITLSEAGTRAMEPIREFMLRNTQKSDLELFLNIGDIDYETIETNDAGVPQVPSHVLMPAFLTSELKQAFLLGFCIYIPFIVIDMIVASTLMSMGMMMLPPVMISLPFKVLLFVSVNGWDLVIKTLLESFK